MCINWGSYGFDKAWRGVSPELSLYAKLSKRPEHGNRDLRKTELGSETKHWTVWSAGRGADRDWTNQ